jgi:hypothetical protein
MNTALPQGGRGDHLRSRAPSKGFVTTPRVADCSESGVAYPAGVTRTVLSFVLLAPLVASPAFAQGAAGSPPPAPAKASASLERAALARIAQALASDLARAPARALIAGATLTSDTPAPRGAQLVHSLVAQLAGRRGAGSHARTEPTALGPARAAAHGDSVLIHLTVEIAAGQLRATADVYPVPRNVWARIRDPEPGPIAHAFAEAPIDAEVRTFLAPIPLTAARVERAKNFEGDVVALACGDLDHDGGLEIISVGRRRVSSVRLRGGRVIPLLSRNWPDLAPVAPAPFREPVGFASLIERGPLVGPSVFVDVGLTDRGKSVRLDADLKVAASFPGIAVPDGDGSACTRLTALTVTGAIGPCAAGDPLPLSASIGGQYDAFASARLLSPRGEPFAVWAGREKGVLEVRDDKGHKMGVESIGAQLAVGDLDQDGDPEILASLDTQNPLDDAVVVRSWAHNSKAPAAARVKEIMRLPAAAGVRALAVCPPDGPGRAPFIVATSDEIWVVR